MSEIAISVKYHANCRNGCGWSTILGTLDAVNEAAAAHRAQHAQWEAAGADLRGKVFGITDLPWKFQIVWDAEKEAERLGYKYLAWNGWVYRVGEFSDEGRVCLDDHVPR